MSSSTASVEFTASDAGVLRLIAKHERAFDKLDRKIDGVGRSSKRAAEAGEQGFRKLGNVLVGAGGILSATEAVRQGVALAVREFEHLKDRQASAADANLEYGKVIAQTVRNASGLLTGDEVVAAVDGASRETGVDPRVIGKAMGDALSARGAENKKQAEEAVAAVKAAAAYAQELDSGSLADLAGAAVDFTRRRGGTPEEAIGTLQRIGGQSRVVDLGNLVRNVAPGVGNVTAYGGTVAEAGALVSVLTSGTGDFTGASSRTAALQLAGQLNAAGYESPDAGIEELRADDAKRAAFLANASFEASAKPTIRDLLTGGTRVAGEYDAAERMIGDAADGRMTYDGMIAEVNAVPSVRLGRIEQAGRAQLTRVKLADREAASAAVSRDLAKRINAATGETWAGGLVDEYATELLSGGSPDTTDVLATIRRREKALRNPRERVFSLGWNALEGPTFSEMQDREPTAREAKAADILAEMAETLRRIEQGGGGMAAGGGNGGGMAGGGAADPPAAPAGMAGGPDRPRRIEVEVVADRTRPSAPPRRRSRPPGLTPPAAARLPRSRRESGGPALRK